MLLFEKVSPLKTLLDKLRGDGKSIGFVATMGALHTGHLALVRLAKSQNDLVIVSIFVNPTQFNKSEDLLKYPRNTEKDLAMLRSVDCDIAILPEVDDIYPKAVKSEEIDLIGLDLNMEGTYRPGHFDGVATVVKRFFEIINPDKAYFGEKDYQQYLVIKHISESLSLGPEVIGAPIERNDHGLALSSRNERLSIAGKNAALIIYDSIRWAKNNFEKFNPAEILDIIKNKFQSSELELEYVEICDQATLKPLKEWDDAKHARIFIAAELGKVRLIDNDSLF